MEDKRKERGTELSIPVSGLNRTQKTEGLAATGEIRQYSHGNRKHVRRFLIDEITAAQG